MLLRRQYHFTLIFSLSLALFACGGNQSRESGGRDNNDSEMTNAARRDMAEADGLLRVGEVVKAREAALRAQASSPRSGAVQVMMAMVEDASGDAKAAAKHFAKSIKYSPNDSAVLNAYGVWLCSKQKYTDADMYFRRAANSPKNAAPANAIINAGLCALSSGRAQLAIQYLRQALPMKPDDPALLVALADASMQTGDALSARAFLQRREALGDIGPELLNLGIKIEESLGDQRAVNRYRAKLAELRSKNESLPERESVRPNRGGAP